MFRFKKFDVVAGIEGAYHRIFKVVFGKDGSIFVIFPGFTTASGILCRAAMPGGMPSAEISLKENGKVTNHLVKFSHHPDGRAHFSQQGKIRTEIKRMSVPLANQWGHLFTVQFQNLDGFPIYHSNGRDHLPFNFQEEPRALKIVGRRFPNSEWGRPGNVTVGKPPKRMQLDEGVVEGEFAKPPERYHFDDYFLFLSIKGIPYLSDDNVPLLIFMGGFDPGDIAFNQSQDTEFLMAAYPCADATALAETLGSVDLTETHEGLTP